MSRGAYGYQRDPARCRCGKITWLGRAGAERERRAMAAHEGRDTTLEVYAACGGKGWHVGHRRAAG